MTISTGVHSRNVPSISNPRIASCLPVCKFSRFIVLYPFISPVYSIGITFPKSDFHTGISNLFFHTDAGHIVISVCFLLRIICVIISSIPYCQKNSTQNSVFLYLYCRVGIDTKSKPLNFYNRLICIQSFYFFYRQSYKFCYLYI